MAPCRGPASSVMFRVAAGKLSYSARQIPTIASFRPEPVACTTPATTKRSAEPSRKRIQRLIRTYMVRQNPGTVLIRRFGRLWRTISNFPACYASSRTSNCAEYLQGVMDTGKKSLVHAHEIQIIVVCHVGLRANPFHLLPEQSDEAIHLG